MKILSIILVLFTVLPAIITFAADGSDPITGIVKTAGKVVEGTMDTVASPFKAMSEGEPANVVADPITEAGKTIGSAAENTGKILTGQKVE